MRGDQGFGKVLNILEVYYLYLFSPGRENKDTNLKDVSGCKVCQPEVISIFFLLISPKEFYRNI